MLPSRDLEAVIALMNEGYAGWQSWRGKTALSVLAVLRRFPPVLWLLQRSASFRQFCSALVYVDDGQVVGFVVTHPIEPGLCYWIGRNIAVRKSHRRHGIAHILTQAMLDRAAAQGAEKIIVMIRTDNVPSLNLVQKFGFRPLAGTTEMRMAASDWTVPPVDSDASIRSLRASEWGRMADLLRAATPAELLAYQPICSHEADLRTARRLWRRVSDLIAGQWEHYLVVEKDNTLAGLLKIEASLWGGDHCAEITVHPRYRGRLEEALVSKALSVLARYPRHVIDVKLFASHKEAIQVLARYGFEERKTQVIHGLDLSDA